MAAFARRLIAAGLPLLFACGDGDRPPTRAAAAAPQPAREDVRALDSPSLRFLPRQQEVAGWAFENDPLVIPPPQLESRLGSDAAHFLAYGMVDLTVGEYSRTDGPGFATIEIFRFPDFIKAFGAYSTRRKPLGAMLSIQNEAYAGPRSVHLWRGPFYVRVIGGGSIAAQHGLVDLVSASAAQMPPAPGKPAVFNFLPESTRIPNSEAFNSREAFGQPLLRNAFTASFKVGAQTVDGLVLPSSSRAAATGILNAFRNFFVVNGRLLDPVPNLGEGNFTAEDRFFGRTIAFRIDRFVIAFRGFVPAQALLELAIATDQRILGSIRNQLQQEQLAAREAARERRPAQGQAESRPEASAPTPPTDPSDAGTPPR